MVMNNIFTFTYLQYNKIKNRISFSIRQKERMGMNKITTLNIFIYRCMYIQFSSFPFLNNT